MSRRKKSRDPKAGAHAGLGGTGAGSSTPILPGVGARLAALLIAFGKSKLAAAPNNPARQRILNLAGLPLLFWNRITAARGEHRDGELVIRYNDSDPLCCMIGQERAKAIGQWLMTTAAAIGDIEALGVVILALEADGRMQWTDEPAPPPETPISQPFYCDPDSDSKH